MTSSFLGYEVQRENRVYQKKYRDGKEIPVYVLKSARRQGMTIFGVPGVGKSGLIINLAIQDIKQGTGICVLDPQDDLINDILERIPQDNIKDVIVLDLLQREYPFGLNPAECPDPTNSTLLQRTIDQVLHVFELIYGIDRNTPHMIQYLRNCIHTIAVNPGYTLAEIPLLLTDQQFRNRLFVNVRDQNVMRFWVAYEKLSPREQREKSDSILNKMEEILQPLSRNIVGQSHTTINMRKMMDEGKIVLIKLSTQLGSVTSLLGSIIVSQLLNASMSREDVQQSQRKQFHFYVDEFSRFQTKDFATLFTETRKYGMGLIVAAQNLEQLERTIQEAALGASTLINFRISGKNADTLKKEFSPECQPIGTRYETIYEPARIRSTHPEIRWQPPIAEAQYNQVWYELAFAREQYQSLLSLPSIPHFTVLIPLLTDFNPEYVLFPNNRNGNNKYANFVIRGIVKTLCHPPYFHHFSNQEWKYSWLGEFYCTYTRIEAQDYVRDLVGDIDYRFKKVYKAYLDDDEYTVCPEKEYLKLKRKILFPLHYPTIIELTLENEINHLQADKEPKPLRLHALEQLLAEIRIWYQQTRIKECIVFNFDPSGYESTKIHCQLVGLDLKRAYRIKRGEFRNHGLKLDELISEERNDAVTCEAIRWLKDKLFQLQQCIETLEARQQALLQCRREEQVENHPGSFWPVVFQDSSNKHTETRIVPGPLESVSNAQDRLRGEFSSLPDFTAYVKLKREDKTRYECFIQTVEPPPSEVEKEKRKPTPKHPYIQRGTKKTLSDRIEEILEQNIADGYLRLWTDVEDEINARQAVTPPPQSPPKTQQTKRLPETPNQPTRPKQMSICPKCEGDNPMQSKFCNHCGLRLH